jgi:hypothetical protein
MTRVSDYLEGHRVLYPARKCNNTRQRYDDELRQIGLDEGLLELEFPPDDCVVPGPYPGSPQEAFNVDSKSSLTKYLWVVAADGVPIALERSEQSKALTRGSLAHTNLTGGADAHTAGELWFHDEDRVVINGGSSRYTPKDPAELMSVARSFKDAGYDVASMGWDDERGLPARMLRGEPEWI